MVSPPLKQAHLQLFHTPQVSGLLDLPIKHLLTARHELGESIDAVVKDVFQVHQKALPFGSAAGNQHDTYHPVLFYPRSEQFAA